MVDDAAVRQKARDRVGTALRGKWHLTDLLGVGGTASVYRAVHRNKSRGAVKILHPELAANAEVRKRFLREGYVANTVDHPGAVSVLDDDVDTSGSIPKTALQLEVKSPPKQTAKSWASRIPSILPFTAVLSIALKAAPGVGF